MKVSREVPERHSARIEREDRKDNLKEAEAKFDQLRDKYGESTDTVPDDREGHEDETIEVKGADCPDCKEGVMVVAPEKTSYPPYKVVCTECGDKQK
jgi:hypothetical protein